MKPHQIISLMTFDGRDNTLAMGDHADHIHVGFAPHAGGDGSRARSDPRAEPVDRPHRPARAIDNPEVGERPSP